MAYGDALKNVLNSAGNIANAATGGVAGNILNVLSGNSGNASTQVTPTGSTASSGTIDWGKQIAKAGTNIITGIANAANKYNTAQQQNSAQGNSQYNAANNYGVTDNSSLYEQMYAQQLAAAQAALQAQIAQGTKEYQSQIDAAPGQYQPLRDQASASGQQNMQNLREMLANNGQAGGVNRTEETQVNTSTENQINTLNAQQQNFIDTAQKAIADLKAQGDLQSAQLVAQNASEKLQALINEKNRVSDTTYNRSQDAFNNNLNVANITGDYNGQRTMAGQQLDEQKAQDAFQNKISEAGITGYYNGKQTMEGQLNSTQLKLLGAQITGQTLDNQSQAIANKYAPQIAKGQIDYQKAQTEYQKLVNAGYSKTEALDNALKSAQIANTQANTAQTNAQTANTEKATRLMGLKTSGSGGGSSSGRSGGRSSSSVNTTSKSMQSSTAAIDDIVNGKYNLSVKERTLKAYMKELKSDGSDQAKYLYNYAKDAYSKVEKQMEQYVYSDYYKGYENYGKK